MIDLADVSKTKLIAFTLLCACSLASSAVVPSERDPFDVINVTSDSEMGWVPSAEQRSKAREILDKYLRAVDGARYQEAYRYLSDIFRRQTDFATFQDRATKFNALAGSVRTRQTVRVTWTKNPAQSPAPGTYAAIDLVSKFENVDRHCGYVVLYQASLNDSFSVMREEQTYLDNASASKIQQAQSSESLERTWAEVAKHCPNYKPIAAVLPPLPEDPGALPYEKVAAALADLKAKAGAEISVAQGGWTIITFKESKEVWSFAPEGHYAYPSVVRRAVRETPGEGVFVDMSVLCEADKAPCDKLVREFQELNNRMADSLRKGH